MSGTRPSVWGIGSGTLANQERNKGPDENRSGYQLASGTVPKHAHATDTDKAVKARCPSRRVQQGQTADDRIIGPIGRGVDAAIGRVGRTKRTGVGGRRRIPVRIMAADGHKAGVGREAAAHRTIVEDAKARLVLRQPDAKPGPPGIGKNIEHDCTSAIHSRHRQRRAIAEISETMNCRVPSGPQRRLRSASSRSTNFGE